VAILPAFSKGPPDDLGKRRVGRAALGVAGPDQDPASGDLHVGRQFTHQPGLADARFAADQQGLPLTTRSLAP